MKKMCATTCTEFGGTILELDACLSQRRTRRNCQALRRKQAGGARLRRTPRSERRPLRRPQRHRKGRADKELFVTRKLQLRWRRIAWRRGISRRRRRRARGRWASVIGVSLDSMCSVHQLCGQCRVGILPVPPRGAGRMLAVREGALSSHFLDITLVCCPRNTVT